MAFAKCTELGELLLSPDDSLQTESRPLQPGISDGSPFCCAKRTRAAAGLFWGETPRALRGFVAFSPGIFLLLLLLLQAWFPGRRLKNNRPAAGELQPRQEQIPAPPKSAEGRPKTAQGPCKLVAQAEAACLDPEREKLGRDFPACPTSTALGCETTSQGCLEDEIKFLQATLSCWVQS